MSGQAWLIATRGDTAVIQEGQPPAQQAAWLLDIPDGSTADDACVAFLTASAFPVGTVCQVIDLTTDPLTVQTNVLTAQWEAAPENGGDEAGT